MSALRHLARFIALAFWLIVAVPASAGDAAQVSNTAVMRFREAGEPRSVSSNTVTLDVARAKVPTRLSFRLLPVDYKLGYDGIACVTDGVEATFVPAAITQQTLESSPALEALDLKQPIIMVLENSGGNRNPNVREKAYITTTSGETSIRNELLETAPNSGVFAGAVPVEDKNRTQVSPCDPRATRGSTLRLDFTEDEYSYGSDAWILVDPAGYVFDSQTGALIDGAEVSLWDENGQRAVVYGDDGVSRYPSTVVTGSSVTDASGRKYDFSQGNYRFPLVNKGKYQISIKPPPGYTAPSTQSPAELAKRKDPTGRHFILNDASFGRGFVIESLDPFYADIPVDRQGDTKLLLTKSASVREASPGDFVQYRVTVANRGEVAARAVQVTDLLPQGLRYERRSTRGADEPEVATDGRSMKFLIPTIAAGASIDLSYVVTVAPGAPKGEAVNRVLASADNGVTGNEASAPVRIKALLFTDGFTLIGRVTEGGCGDPSDKRKGVPNIRLMLEDGTFVITDKDGLYHVEGVRPGRHVVQIDTASLPATHEPVACDADTRQAGSAISRFVESDGGLLKRVDFQLRPTGLKAETTSALPLVASDAHAAGNRDWLPFEQPGIAMLFPEVDHNPRAPTLRVVIKHYPSQRVALRLNGQPIDPLAFDTTDADAARNVAISRWTGLPLAEGDNQLEARVLAADGTLVETLTRTVHASGAAVTATFVPEKSLLVADGLTRPLIAVRLTDRAGKPARDGTTVAFRVDQPYVAATEIELQQARQLAGTDSAEATARVTSDDGLAFIALEPTTQAGAVHATLTLGDRDAARTGDIRAWLAATQKDWMIVGFGSGTIGYDTLKTRSSALPRSQRGKLVTDGQLAFYAKGRIKGSWLLTLAYDSDRSFDPDRGLLGTIDPNRYYTAYGDGSRQGYDAPTRRKLYLRLERREFYALFGDFETGLTRTNLGRYSRTLNGAKVEYQGKTISFTGFAAHSEERYARDEFQGNGLSGPYRLSARDIIPNSDKLRIEVRDRLRPELVVSSELLTRHIDYDIDVTSGTIRFRQPVLSRDAQLNPIFVVVEYETFGRGKKLVAGGRAAASLAQGKVELGASAIRDESVGDGNGTIVAVDVKARPAKNTELRGELATGGRQGINSGRAWLAEAEHHGQSVDVLVYARQQDRGFGLGQQNLIEAGTRKLGVDGSWRLNDKLTFTGTVWHQQQLDAPGTRTAADVRLEHRRQGGTVFVGGQLALDRGMDGKDRNSKLLTIGGSQALFDGKLELSGQTQFAPGGDKASVDFPVRHQINAALRVKDGIRLLGGYEIAKGDDYTAHTARVGFDVAPWTGAKLTSTLNQQAVAEDGRRTFAQYGLSQSLPLGKSWTIDASLDASNTISGKVPTGAAINAFSPIGVGSGFAGQNDSGDFTAVTLGATYRAARWSWTGRLEFRHGDKDDRWNLTTSVLRTLGEGQTLAAGLRYSRLRQRDGASGSSLNADVALALRPLDSRWSLLERFEFRNDKADAGITAGNVLGISTGLGGFQSTLRLVNNLAVNYRSGAEGDGHGFEATVYYGSKWVRGSFGDDDYTGYVDVIGFDLRKDLGRRFDLGVQGSMQHAWNRGAKAFSFGPSAGFSPGGNLWVSAGYNVAGYRDRDFENDRYTRQGAYLTMRLKFDQASIGRALGKAR
ncbi:DUF11 domain-containing protein [Novosphingobium sp. JCM 18896]|uniref:DUF11 domain-containing protein n=1 Tax=Novosphingobium sp. JCM 18896 TaxID=2989731 RepID=UPI0022221752|nr:DUF11 domain-containing protein [Novosphingobium sp. JCM 18896]MCW1430753.1 DUF11 domain-containing protein [Novosphingobium sp. JCM 18896]